MPLEHPIGVEPLEVEAPSCGGAGFDGREPGRLSSACQASRARRLEDADGGHQADQLSCSHTRSTVRGLRGDTLDEHMERGRAHVHEVRRHLHAIAERQTECLDARQATGRLAHHPGDRLRILERALELEVERDKRRTHTEEHGAGPRVETRGAVRGRELRCGYPPAKLLEAPAPIERRRPSLADVAVEKNRKPELVGHPACNGVRHRHRIPDVGGVQRHDGHDVRGTHPRVRAGVEPEIDPPSRLVDARDETVLEGALVPDERDDGTVVIGVEVDVEHARASLGERRRDRVDGGAIPALGEVRHGFEQRHRPTLWSMRRSSAPTQVEELQRRNARCRRCLVAGFPIVLPPVFAGHSRQHAYLFGLAPGRVEAETGLPWQGRAGRTLRRWLRLDEETFFASFYCASVTRCFPGSGVFGRGVRRATRAEQSLCESWRREELRLLEPALVVTVGLTPAAHLLGVRRLGDAIGKSFLLRDAIAVPLPHPSAASGWLNDPTNRARLGKAVTHVRRELSRLNVA